MRTGISIPAGRPIGPRVWPALPVCDCLCLSCWRPHSVRAMSGAGRVTLCKTLHFAHDESAAASGDLDGHGQRARLVLVVL